MKTKLIKTASGMEVRIWEGEEPKREDYEPYTYGFMKFKEAHDNYLSSYKSYPVRSEDEEGFKWVAWEAWCNARGKAPVVGINHNYDFNCALEKGIEIASELVGFEEVDVPIKYTNGEYSRTIQMVKHAILLPLKESLSFPEMNKKDSEQHDHYMNHCQVCGKHKHATLLTEDKEGEGQGDAVEFARWLCVNKWKSENGIYYEKGFGFLKEPELKQADELYKLFKQQTRL